MIITIQKLFLLLGHLGLINFFERTAKFGYKQAQRSGTRHNSQVPPVGYVTLPMFCDKSAMYRKSAFYDMGGVILNIYVKFLYQFRVQRYYFFLIYANNKQEKNENNSSLFTTLATF